jgi:Cu-processing system ATP-binding protein
MSDIDVDGVTKRYGSVRALDDVSLQVPEESTFGLLGTNGAGKTTLFKLLVGHEQPDVGSLRVAGHSTKDGVEVRRTVGYLPEQASFPENFTGREVLDFHAEVRKVPPHRQIDRIDEALEFVGLTEAADRRVGGYSKGMNRRLGLATVILANPEVLLLDEPTAGLDPQGVNAFHDVVESFVERTETTIVFSSHTLVEVERLCDRIGILHEGRLKAAGEINELRERLDSTVELWVDVGPENITEVLSRFQGETTIESIEPVGDRLQVKCVRGETYSILESINQVAPVRTFEVDQPGIDEVFRAAMNSELTSEPNPT